MATSEFTRVTSRVRLEASGINAGDRVFKGLTWLLAAACDWPLLGGLVAGPALGRDLLSGGVILAVMILPTVMSVAREVLLTVPPTQREGMLALGATHWETIWNAVLPYARAGIIGGA